MSVIISWESLIERSSVVVTSRNTGVAQYVLDVPVIDGLVTELVLARELAKREEGDCVVSRTSGMSLVVIRDSLGDSSFIGSGER